jgi:hypothetical protein
MRHKFLGLMTMGLLTVALMSPVPAQEIAGEVAHWDFDVYLNDKKVGKHEFKVSEIGALKQVRSEADFDYKILFFSAYKYQHSAAERWSGNCLAEFDASTNANGKRIQVSGQQSGTGFSIERNGSKDELPECVMTFAYWNQDFLGETQLLNPQTGEYLDVLVEEVGDEMLEVRGQTVTASRFRLTANEVDLTLWYSLDNEWLALESVAKGGHIIRYELS